MAKEALSLLDKAAPTTTAAQGGFGAFLGTAMPYLGFAAQLGLGLLNQDQQATEQRRQRDAANRQLKIQTHQENERRRIHNQREGQLAMIRERIKTQQLDFNRQAAQIAFAAEQQRLDDIFTRSGFASNQQKVMLMQACLLYTSPSPRDGLLSRMPSSA